MIETTNITEGIAPIRRLRCCCCDSSTMGRQWHNRDTGFGFCQACASRLKEKYSAQEMLNLYGGEGYHYPDAQGEIQL